MKKILFLYLIVFNSFLLCQIQDTINWINYDDNKLGIAFKYPTFFYLENQSSFLDSISDPCLSLSFTYYPEYGTSAEMGYGDSTEMLYLEFYESLDIVISKRKLSEVTSQYGYILKDSLWYDEEMITNGWYDEPASKILFDGWEGYSTFTPTRVYLKDGGCVTAAGDRERSFFFKEFNSNTYIYAFAERFDFENADEILKQILQSITLNK